MVSNECKFTSRKQFRVNTEFKLLLPYGLYHNSFSRETWDNIDRYDFFLQVTTHPICKVVNLK